MTTIFQDLQTIGLSANQSHVYLTLARLGPVKAGEIIKKIGLHRNLVYVALEDLMGKKLVASSKEKGVTVYKMLSPHRLTLEPQEKERVAKNIAEELIAITKKRTSGQEIVVFEGLEEFRRHEERMYHAFIEKHLVRYLGISPAWQDVMGSELENKLIDIQAKKGVRMHALTNGITAGQKLYVAKTMGLAEVRVNKLISSDTNNTVILDDRISIRSFLEPYFVVEIVNSALAKNYCNYFDFLWKQSK